MTRTNIIILALAVLGGCGDLKTVPVSFVVQSNEQCILAESTFDVAADFYADGVDLVWNGCSVGDFNPLVDFSNITLPWHRSNEIVIHFVSEIYGDEENPVSFGFSLTENCQSVVAVEVIDPPIVVIHEVGHRLGLNHVDNDENIMSTKLSLNSEFSINDNQIEAIIKTNKCN